MDATYKIEVGGFQVATFRLKTLRQGAGHASLIDVASQGFLRRMLDFDSRSEARGPVTDAGPRPERYAALTFREDPPRETRIVFDPQSGDVVELELVRRGRARESEVPLDLRTGVVDPLTALSIVRSWVLSGPDEPVQVDVFDGRRRYDVTVTDQGSISSSSDEVPLRQLRIDMELRAGFESSEASFVGEGGFIEGLVTDDGRALPISFRTEGTRLGTTFELDEDCSVDGCDDDATFSLLPED